MPKARSAVRPGEHALEVIAKPGPRSLAQVVASLVPPLGPAVAIAADNYLMNRRTELQKERLGTLIQELEATSTVVSEERLRDNEFCNLTIAVAEAAVRTRRHKKIIWFATLLSNYDRIVVSNNEDDFEELLRVLDDMSVKEFQTLLLLDNLEGPDVNRKSSPEDTTGYWSEFRRKASLQGVPEDQLFSFLHRLARTGCLSMLGSAYPHKAEKYAFTTDLFRRLVEAVGEA